MPDVSVIVPTRNRKDLLWVTLRTVLAQRGVDLDVVVVDDASTDGTADAVRGLDDPRVRLIRQQASAGVSAARNRGIAEASGAWIAFLDDDDLWSPDKLVRQLETATREARGWAYTGDVNVDRNLHVLTALPPPTPETVMRSLSRYNPVPTGASNVVVRADLLRRVGVFDPRLRRTEDWDLWIRLAQTGPPSLVNAPLVAYRFHAANVADDTDSILAEPEALAERYGIPIDRAAVRRRAAWTCLRAGRRRAAVRHYAHAVAMGDLASIGRAAIALTHPAVGSERVFVLQRGPRTDESWRAEAQAWLDDVRMFAPKAARKGPTARPAPARTRAIKVTARRALRYPVAGHVARAIGVARGRSLALVYHRIDAEPRAATVVPAVSADLFRRHVEALADVADIVSLEELLGDLRRRGRPRVALTFDDDFVSHADHALPVLASAGLRATFFLSGRSLHGLGPYWFELLDDLVVSNGVKGAAQRLGIETADLHALVAVCESDRRMPERLAAEAGFVLARHLDGGQIRSLADAGMSIGFHTLQHSVLTRLHDEELLDALMRGRAELENAVGRRLRLFAYPHGKADARVARATADAGFSAAWTGRPTAMRRGSNRMLLGRWEPGPAEVDVLLVGVALRLNAAGADG
jgi:peptidoglycan/xylan/chitin deacetylase (PgdA/CDA1 family)